MQQQTQRTCSWSSEKLRISDEVNNVPAISTSQGGGNAQAVALMYGRAFREELEHPARFIHEWRLGKNQSSERMPHISSLTSILLKSSRPSRLIFL